MGVDRDEPHAGADPMTAAIVNESVAVHRGADQLCDDALFAGSAGSITANSSPPIRASTS